MYKSVWIIFLSLQSMIHCAIIGQGNGVLPTGSGIGANIGPRPLNPVTPQVAPGANGNVNSRSLTLGGGLHPAHNSPLVSNFNGGFNIGNGYLGYSSYHRSQPVVFQGKALPVTTTIIKNPEPAQPDFTMTPSLSYGYSYKLVPTYAYAPAPAQPQTPQKPLFNFNSLNNLFSQLASNLYIRRTVPPHQQPQPQQVQPNYNQQPLLQYVQQPVVQHV